MPISRTRAALAASAFSLLFAGSSAIAQDYDDGYTDRGPSEQVVVTAPPYYSHRGATTGAPIRDVALQREVRFDDLDLQSDWGARALKQRVSTAARLMCSNLDRMYPISASDSPPCYRTAYDDAMAQADQAIREARGYDDE